MIKPEDWGTAAPQDWFAERLTVREFLAIFDCAESSSRYVPNADSEEYLAVVLYLVSRNQA